MELTQLTLLLFAGVWFGAGLLAGLIAATLFDARRYD